MEPRLAAGFFYDPRKASTTTVIKATTMTTAYSTVMANAFKKDNHTACPNIRLNAATR